MFINAFSTFNCNGLYHNTYFFLSIGMQIVTPEVVPVKLESAQRKVTLQWLYKANQNSMKNDSGHLKVVHLWDFLTCTQPQYCLCSFLIILLFDVTCIISLLPQGSRVYEGLISTFAIEIYFAIKNPYKEQKSVETSGQFTKAGLFSFQHTLDVFFISGSWSLFHGITCT